MNLTTNHKFKLGRIVATPGAIEALEKANTTAIPFLARHQRGDWGNICPEDKELNDQAIKYEGQPDKQQRVLSSYKLPTGRTIWIITESDRSVTTILLPKDY